MTQKSARTEALEAALGYTFSDPSLLEGALTHRSHAHERGKGAGGHYERLEFLGDALLGFIVSECLYREDPSAAEGPLTRRRQSVVRSSTLAARAGDLGLGRAIRLGKGEELTGGRSKPSLLADVLEAVLGAIYLDGGIRAARAFVRRHLGAALRQAGGDTSGGDDFKTRLQEALQADLQRTPRYRIVSTSGPAHALVFDVEVLVEGDALGRGSGGTRKQAEQAAARQALKRLAGGERTVS